MPDPEPFLSSSAAGLRGEKFDPATLDRSVIATPLLNDINAEIELIERVRGKERTAALEFNSAILLPEAYSVSSASVRAAVQQLLDEAVNTAVQRAAPEHQAGWEKLRARHRLGEQVPGANALFAWIDARVVRRIMASQTRRLREDKAMSLQIEKILPSRFPVIIDLNLEFLGGRDAARKWVAAAIPVAKEQLVDDPGQGIDEKKTDATNQYVFAAIEADVIARLVEMDAAPVELSELAAAAPVTQPTAKEVKADVVRQFLPPEMPADKRAAAIEAIPRSKLRAIYHIWPDFEIKTRITKSIATVKANAAINSFAARGKDITWAVMDTGIQGDHPHFSQRKNIVDPASPLHRDFTSEDGGPLVDANGHGTHVAGIIAGEWIAPKGPDGKPAAQLTSVARYQDEHGDTKQDSRPIEEIRGMAPDCQLVSLKVLDENGIGNASNLISALAHVQAINNHGRRLRIHGVNISIGYDFDPKWFACGQSPLCVEVDRLVKCGVVVVVAAGNTGYGAVNNGSSNAGLTVTINDPGNAELAITVGATHRDMPHVYGVSYFSSKGPTGDGRLKPDLVAPGERIVSCASSLPLPAGAAPGTPRPPSELKKEVARNKEGVVECDYIETSGTSMAAPHVSGVIAAFLSVRREFIGQPEKVKEIFVSTSTDLRRDRYFQGAGLVDVMRAIQSI